MDDDAETDLCDDDSEEDEDYCDRCNNTGEVDCCCGGDLCVCGANTLPCPACRRGIF